MPVVDEGKLVGIVTTTDLINYLLINIKDIKLFQNRKTLKALFNY